MTTWLFQEILKMRLSFIEKRMYQLCKVLQEGYELLAQYYG